MTLEEMLNLLARVVAGKCRIEIKVGLSWVRVHWNAETKRLITVGTQTWWTLGQLIDKEGVWVREREYVPSLSKECVEFLSYYPKDGYIGRDKDCSLHFYSEKPEKQRGFDKWVAQSGSGYERIKYAPQFKNINWEDDECYMIKDLLEGSKEGKE